ncbi:MAG TPA: SOS response-associated peptidase [Kofleriaceae bacterium]|nr:SOS response-associated peptidase [Kofleriaceae bacterium]
MCGRYTLTRHEKVVEDLEASLPASASHDPWWKPRFNVAPTQPAPVVIARGGGRAIELMRWGLVPFWADLAGKKPPLMINARVESLSAKQFFRDALERKRCLVPADGFFEWIRAQGATGKKAAPQPFYFHPRADRLFAFAGLWARSHDEAGGELHSFTIITTRADDLVRPIHDRMPIVLAPDAYAAWLDPELDGAAARALLGAPATGDWQRDAVSTWVNKADHDDPGCIAPAGPAASSQGQLFDP